MPLTPPLHARRLDSAEVGVIGGQAVPFVFAMPSGIYEFICLTSLYLSDATVGLRAPTLTIADDTGGPIIAVSLGVQNAGFLIRYSWQVGSAFSAGFGVIVQRNIPPGLILKTAWTMTVDSIFKGAGDMQTIGFQLKRLT